MVVRAHKDISFKKTLNRAQLKLADGVGLIWAAQVLGLHIPERVTGTDMVENLCREAAVWPVTVGFFGGRGKVAEEAAECLRKKYSGLRVVYADNEWDPAQIEGAKIDVLFVALGFPKQENWMAEHLGDGTFKIAIGVGGALDYISGNVSRAPRPVRKIGLEWFYRLARQPWRLKRQTALGEFVALVLKEKISPTSS
jgi:N-acetylglucosaminyldiphosphoundecaprenol N-acetyl-beta-D-mannosaminyltransferase